MIDPWGATIVLREGRLMRRWQWRGRWFTTPCTRETLIPEAAAWYERNRDRIVAALLN